MTPSITGKTLPDRAKTSRLAGWALTQSGEQRDRHGIFGGDENCSASNDLEMHSRHEFNQSGELWPGTKRGLPGFRCGLPGLVTQLGFQARLRLRRGVSASGGSSGGCGLQAQPRAPMSVAVTSSQCGYRRDELARAYNSR
jgi:hypothetical protein